MSRIIAIGDIHGCFLTFKKLLTEELQVTKEDEIVLLGDLIDRGPSIRQLIDEILQMQSEGYNIFSIMGNHEWLLLKSLESDDYFDLWVKNKGKTTLQSFHVNDAFHIPKKYLDFFRSMPYYYLTSEFILVHAGMNFEIENPFDDIEAMVWKRNTTINRSKIGNRRLIVGHTPSPIDLVLATQNSDRMLLDGGCVYKNVHPGLGYLCAFDITNNKLYYKNNIDL